MATQIEDIKGMIRTHFATARRWSVFALYLFTVAAAGGAHAQFKFPEGLQNYGGNQAEEVTVEAQFTAPTEDRPAMLFVTAKVVNGFHIYATDQPALPDNGGGPMATRISVSANGSNMQVVEGWRSIQPPSVHVDHEIWAGLEIREHYGEVTWYTPLKVAAGVDLSTLALQVDVVGQACNPQSCVPFELQTIAQLGDGVPLPVKATHAPSAAGEGIGFALLPILGYGILGGLILNLMPCVLPVIGLKLMSFAKQGGQSRSHILLLNLSYAAGLLTVFMILATLAMLVQLNIGSENFGWGELYTRTWFKVGMVALVFSMALSFLGVWEIPIPGFASSGKATELSSREGPLGAFCMGMFTTILATPCSGPFLGPVLGYTISQQPSVIYAIFASIGLGMSLPYLLIGAFPSLVSWLPKPGAWMDTLKQLLGFVLLATVVYLFSTLNPIYFIATLALTFGIWFACWIIGQVPLMAPSALRSKAWLKGTLAASLVGFLAFALLTPGKSVLPWQQFTPQALAAARAEGKTVLVDFSANWCLTCKTNLKLAINRKEVKDLVEKNGTVTLLADWTDRNDTIKQTLLEHNSQSIPLMVIYPADPAQETIVLRDVLTKQEVLDALQQAGPSRGLEGQRGMATAPLTPEFGSLYDRKSTVR